jgi:hypothetical protein
MMDLRTILSIMLATVVFAFITVVHSAEKKQALSKGVSVKTMESSRPSSQGKQPTPAKRPKLYKPPEVDKPTKTKPEAKPKGALSDLRIDEIWLDGQCRINFRLRNTGKDAMPDEEHRQELVKIYCGKAHEDYYLGKRALKKKRPVKPDQAVQRLEKSVSYNPSVDPNGVLKRRGGTLSYNTKLKLKERLRVRAYVGHIGRIAKADMREGKSVTLIPQCAAALASDRLKKERAKLGPKTTESVQRAVQALKNQSLSLA